MYGLASSTIGLTAILTGAALMVTASQLGSDFVLYMAMLGENALWLLPVHVAIALPAALFGGALLAASGSRTDAMRAEPGEIMALTIVAALFSAYLVGWSMPAAYHVTGEAASKYTGVKQERAATSPPAGRELPELLRDPSPEAHTELGERLRLTIACVVFGALAAALGASPLSWSPQTALGATAVAFIWQARDLVARIAAA